jgi:hypothetical protein
MDALRKFDIVCQIFAVHAIADVVEEMQVRSLFPDFIIQPGCKPFPSLVVYTGGFPAG